MIPPGSEPWDDEPQHFRDTGFKNLDISLAKNFKWGERFGGSGPLEIFNLSEPPESGESYGGQNGFGFQTIQEHSLGCACATPDVSAPIRSSVREAAVHANRMKLPLTRCILQHFSEGPEFKPARLFPLKRINSVLDAGRRLSIAEGEPYSSQAVWPACFA